MSDYYFRITLLNEVREELYDITYMPDLIFKKW